MKVFQIGFNRCGTTSIFHRLNALGFRAVHMRTPERRNLARVMHDNLAQARHILTELEHYDAFTDMGHLTQDRHLEGYKLFPEIMAQVPDSVFILNVRNVDDWIRSRMDHNDGDYAQAMLRVRGLPTLQDLAEAWRQDWAAHVAAVHARIPPERLLVLDIDTDDLSAIDRFTGRTPVAPVSDVPHNFKRSGLSRLLSRIVPRPIKALLPRELNRRFHYLIRRR